MSVKTWMEEYYTDASVAASKGPLAAIEQAIQKFTGALSRNLDRHGVVREHGNIIDGYDTFEFGIEQCALCQLYYRPEDSCVNCPLYKIDFKRACYMGDSTYGQFAMNNSEKSVKNMIEKLEAAKVFAE